MSGDTAARKFELHQPLARRQIGIRRKFPFLRSFGRKPRKILARTMDLQVLGNHISCAINGHANRDFDLAADRIARTARDSGNLCMDHRRGCGAGLRRRIAAPPARRVVAKPSAALPAAGDGVPQQSAAAPEREQHQPHGGRGNEPARGRMARRCVSTGRRRRGRRCGRASRRGRSREAGRAGVGEAARLGAGMPGAGTLASGRLRSGSGTLRPGRAVQQPRVPQPPVPHRFGFAARKRLDGPRLRAQHRHRASSSRGERAAGKAGASHRALRAGACLSQCLHNRGAERPHVPGRSIPPASPAARIVSLANFS